MAPKDRKACQDLQVLLARLVPWEPRALTVQSARPDPPDQSALLDQPARLERSALLEQPAPWVRQARLALQAL